MAWETELSAGDVIDLDDGKILIAVTAKGSSGSRIRIHANRSVSIKKNGGRGTIEATQEGSIPTFKNEVIEDGKNHHRA